MTLYFEDGGTATKSVALPPLSRVNVQVTVDFPQAAGKRFAAIVESVGNNPADLVVERAMYSNSGGVVWSAGTNAVATKIQSSGSRLSRRQQQRRRVHRGLAAVAVSALRGYDVSLARLRADPPDRPAGVVRDQQRAIFQLRHARRTAVDLRRRLVRDETGQEVLGRSGRFPAAERDEQHLVARELRAVPRAVLRDERAVAVASGNDVPR